MRPVSYLALSLQCDQLDAPPMRIDLTDAREVSIGRGPAHSVARNGVAVVVRVPDKRMSSDHARMWTQNGAWYAQDAGSKNGIRLNGTPVPEARVLSDHDVVEVGRCFFVFREYVHVDGAYGDLEEWDSELPPSFRTQSPVLAAQIEQLRKIAGSPTPVLLQGETGTGKEIVSRAIHIMSGCTGDFVAVNCGALPQPLVESALFGHTRGAFSGAMDTNEGFVRAADAGTLLLDEIAELAPASQVALLRVLQESEVVPVGATRPVAVCVRFIAATHQDIDARLDDGSFRRDLFTRLSAFRLTLPPLRERLEDLGLLVGAIVRRRTANSAMRLRVSAARLLFLYDWLGNIRELDNVLGAAIALASDGEIASRHLPAALAKEPPRSLQERKADTLRAQLIELHRKHHGNVSAVARELGKARQQVHRWNRRLQIDPDAFRD